MNEAEVYVELIDDEEANAILTFFNENPTGIRKETATLEQKKIQIKRVFKSMTPNMKRKRRSGKGNPFYTYINKYSNISKDKGKSFKDHLHLLKDMEINTPGYVRFANILLSYPQETREAIEEIEKNIKLGNDPLDLNVEFQTVGELKVFLRSFREYIGEKAPEKIVELLVPFQSKDYLEQLRICKEQIEKHDLLQYYNEKEELNQSFGNPLSHAAYIHTHQEEDYDILLLFAIEATFETLNKQRFFAKEQIDYALEQFKEKHEKLLSNIKLREVEVSQLKTDLNKSSKNNKYLKSEVQNLTKKLTFSSQKYETLNNEQKELQKKHKNEIEVIQRNFNNKVENLEKDLQLTKNIENERISKFQVDDNSKTDWGIICPLDAELIKEIYPEIPIIHAEVKLDNFLVDSNIETVYLLMNGLSTRNFKRIEREIAKYNKTYDYLELKNSKELIEWIGYKKTIERKGVKL